MTVGTRQNGGAEIVDSGPIGFIAGATPSTKCPASYTEVGYAATRDELTNLINSGGGGGGQNPNAVIYNNNGTPANPNTVTVANGVNGRDAVNVDQLNGGMSTTLNNANNYTDSKITGAITTVNNYTDSKVEGAINTANNYTDAKTKYFAANSTGAATVVTGKDSVGIGPGTVVSGNNAIGGGLNAIVSGDNSVVFGADARGTAAGVVAVGSGSAAIAAGAAAFGQQANASGVNSLALGANANSTAVGATAVGTASQALGAGSTAVGQGAVAKSAGDVAMGSGATAIGEAGKGSAVAIGAGNRATGAGAVAIGDPTIATGTGAVAAGFNSIATADGTATGGAADGAVAMGNASIATGQGSVALGNKSVTGGAGGIAIGDQARAQLANGIAMGSGASAVNVGDVAIGAGSATAAAVGTASARINGRDYAFAGTAPTSTVSFGTSGAERTLTNVAAGRLTSTSTDAVNGSQLNATNQAVNLLGATISGNNTSNLPPASATGSNSVAIGAGSVATRADTISFGTPGAERQLTNVAPATASTDAPNLGQVRSMLGGGLQEARQYTDQQIQALDAKTQKQMAGVGALAMASAALVPNARAEGNASISVGTGHYGGESAFAAGINYYVSNQLLLNSKIAYTSAGPAKVGVSFGATWGF